MFFPMRGVKYGLEKTSSCNNSLGEMDGANITTFDQSDKEKQYMM